MLVVDTGDTLYGKSAADRAQAPLLIAAMNAMGYDAMALGEYDLMVGLAEVQARFREAQFPVLSANAGPAETLGVLPYVVRAYGEHRVALIGVTSPTAQARGATLGVSLSVEDPLQAVQRAVQEVQGQADVILVLSNLSAELNKRMAAEVPGIDAILGAAGGATIQAFEVPGPEGMVVLQAAGTEGQGIGVLTLGFDRQGHVVSYSGSIWFLTPSYADNPEMVRLMQQYGVRP
ncbi:MAG: hypothetical protein ACP5SI_01425 [Chloroflexia bacterium]